MNESHKCNAKREKLDTKEKYTLRLYLYEVHRQARFTDSHGNRYQNSGYAA